MKKKKSKKEIYFSYPMTKREVRAVIKALEYDVEENGYSYLKENLSLMLKFEIGDIKFID